MVRGTGGVIQGVESDVSKGGLGEISGDIGGGVKNPITIPVQHHGPPITQQSTAPEYHDQSPTASVHQNQNPSLGPNPGVPHQQVSGQGMGGDTHEMGYQHQTGGYGGQGNYDTYETYGGGQHPGMMEDDGSGLHHQIQFGHGHTQQTIRNGFHQAGQDLVNGFGQTQQNIGNDVQQAGLNAIGSLGLGGHVPGQSEYGLGQSGYGLGQLQNMTGDVGDMGEDYDESQHSQGATGQHAHEQMGGAYSQTYGADGQMGSGYDQTGSGYDQTGGGYDQTGGGYDQTGGYGSQSAGDGDFNGEQDMY